MGDFTLKKKNEIAGRSRKEKRPKLFLVLQTGKVPLFLVSVLLLYLISILNSKVTHTDSIHEYTQLVMLTH